MHRNKRSVSLLSIIFKYLFLAPQATCASIICFPFPRPVQCNQGYSTRELCQGTRPQLPPG